MVRLSGQLSTIPWWGVFPNNHHLISGFKSEGEQTKSQVFNTKIVVLPGKRLPNTIVLVSHGPIVIAILLAVIFEYLGPSVTLFSIDLLHLSSHFLYHILLSQ